MGIGELWRDGRRGDARDDQVLEVCEPFIILDDVVDEALRIEAK